MPCEILENISLYCVINLANFRLLTNSELINLYSWLKANKLTLKIVKTEFMVISTRQTFLVGNCSEINIQLDPQPIQLRG